MADQQEGAEEEPKKSKLPLIIGVVVVLLGGGAGAYFSGMLGGGDAADGEQTADAAKLPAQYIPFKPDFISNYKINGRPRYMRVKVAAMTREDEVRVAIEQHMPALRNELVMLFGASDFDVLKTPEGKDALRQAALEVSQAVMQTELGKPGIEQILFTDFVLQ